MKVLFTCVGRRVELIQAFRNAANNLSIDLEITGADVSESAPALSFCDNKLIVPEIKNINYIPVLKDYCVNNCIDVLIPTIDTDLVLLAKNTEQFIGTHVLVSAPSFVEACMNKEITAELFKKSDLEIPQEINVIDNNISFPVHIKPKNGSSSINAYIVRNRDELDLYTKVVNDYLIQQYIKGTEYTVDTFSDFSGQPIFITPRIRLAVRSGEVLKTVISQNDEIINEVKKLLIDNNVCGPATVQLIKEENTNKNYYIEINPRFGGGSPLSMKAGADSAMALLRLLNGEKLGYMYKAAEDGLVFARFDQSVIVNEGK